VPTSVLVSTLVALLSIWVGQVFARQTADRQKSQELRTAIVVEISAKATRLLIAARKPPLADYKPAAVNDGLLDRWTEDADVLAAKLRVYFPKKIQERWLELRNAASSFVLAAMDLPEAKKRHAGESWKQVLQAFRDAKLDPEDQDMNLILSFQAVQNVDAQVSDWPEAVASDVAERSLSPESAVVALDLALRDAFRHFTDEILYARLAGFSTTRGDLVSDLLP
jgi:hypothetical protein